MSPTLVISSITCLGAGRFRFRVDATLKGSEEDHWTENYGVPVQLIGELAEMTNEWAEKAKASR